MATPVTLPGVYTLIVEFANISNPELTWRNTWDFAYPTVPAIGSDLPFAIAAFSTGFIWSDAQIVKRSLYNWSKGTQPYPAGEPLQVDTSLLPGAAAATFPSLATPHHPPGAEVCLRADREPFVGGKPGRLFIRTLLGTGDISAIAGGKWTMVTPLVNVAADFNSAAAGSGLSAFYGEPPSGKHLCVVRYSPKTNTVHGESPLNTISLIGVTTAKMNRKNRR